MVISFTTLLFACSTAIGVFAAPKPYEDLSLRDSSLFERSTLSSTG